MKVYTGTDSVLRAKAETKEDMVKLLALEDGMSVHTVENKRSNGYAVLTCPKAGEDGCLGTGLNGKKFSKRGIVIHDIRVHKKHPWRTRTGSMLPTHLPDSIVVSTKN